MESRELGQKGEAVAAKYYIDRGCRLLAHNFRTRQGELDLVLLDGETVVIAEVKTRTDAGFAAPAQAVGPQKQRRLILAAELFLQQKRLGDCPVRFDVVEVLPGSKGWQVHCIKNAFEV